MEEQSAVITLEILEGTAKGRKELNIMVQDIEEGEAKLKDTPIDEETLRGRLGLPHKRKCVNAKTSNRQRRPGDRLPERDPVGEKRALAA